MAGDHFYLQLHAQVEYDPRLASLSRSERDIFTQMRMMALRTTEPGVLQLTWDGFCSCMHIFSERKRERLLGRFEERLLMGIREPDGFIVIAGWTMPQLNGASAEMPGRKPSDAAEATRERKRKEREAARIEMVAGALDLRVDEPNVTPLSEDVTPPVTPCHAPYIDRDREEQQTESKSNNNNSISDPLQTDTSGSGEDVVVAFGTGGVIASLVEEGVTPGVAQRLAQSYPPDRICRQVGWIDQRSPNGNRAGMLRKAIEEDWPQPSAPKPPSGQGGSLQDVAAEELAAIQRMRAAGTWIGAGT